MATNTKGRLEEEEEDYEYEIFHQQPASAEQRVYRHALESVTRAGLDPDEVQVLAVDIGVLTTKEEGEPQIYRTWSLPDDIDYIQPFVQLRVPTEANGEIRFEIIDGRRRRRLYPRGQLQADARAQLLDAEYAHAAA